MSESKTGHRPDDSTLYEKLWGEALKYGWVLSNPQPDYEDPKMTIFYASPPEGDERKKWGGTWKRVAFHSETGDKYFVLFPNWFQLEVEKDRKQAKRNKSWLYYLASFW